MSKGNDTGVYQMKNGLWAYRFKITVDGKEINRRRTTDAKGKKLQTKQSAIKARTEAIALAKVERTQKKKVIRRTIKEVYEEYVSKGRADRAYQTRRKQDSLWDNHLCQRFGSRFIDDISPAERPPKILCNRRSTTV